MGAMKRYAEQISMEMGFGGEINGAVLREGQKRLDALKKGNKEKDQNECTK